MKTSPALDELILSLSDPDMGTATQNFDREARTDFWTPCRKVQETRSRLNNISNPSLQDIIDIVYDFYSHSDEIEQFMGEYAQSLRNGFNNHFRAPVVRTSLGGAIRIIAHKYVALGISVIDINKLALHKTLSNSETVVKFSGRVSILKFLKSNGGKLGLWTCPPIDDFANIPSNLKCKKSETKIVVDGSIFEYDGRTTSVVFDAAKGSMAFMTAEVLIDNFPVGLSFSSSDFRIKDVKSASSNSSRIEVMTTLLADIGTDDDIDKIKPYLDHDHHYIRWHIMQCLLSRGADEEVYNKLLDMSKNDANLDVRNAALKSIELLHS